NNRIFKETKRVILPNEALLYLLKLCREHEGLTKEDEKCVKYKTTPLTRMWNNQEKVDVNRIIELQTFKNINRIMKKHRKGKARRIKGKGYKKCFRKIFSEKCFQNIF
ncbi:MAG TPA: hypothetical protein GXX65_07755, partial [Methanosarcina sp.]|nr:hypothetical protein [Methanosarcina sp.]